MSNKTSDENVANEEITNNKNKYTYIKEVAERIVNEYREKYKDEKFYPEPSEQTCMAYEILHLLAEREQMLKAINTVEKEKGEWIEECVQKDKRIKELENEQRKYFINKQVVIDKLERHKFAYEELGKILETKKYESEELKEFDSNLRIAEDRIVQVLQELLEGEK